VLCANVTTPVSSGPQATVDKRFEISPSGLEGYF